MTHASLEVSHHSMSLYAACLPSDDMHAVHPVRATLRMCRHRVGDGNVSQTLTVLLSPCRPA